MKIECLYPEIATEFGDGGNVRILERLFPEAQFFRTPFPEIPRFLQEEIDLVYLGAMEESHQDRLLAHWRPLQSDLQKAITRGQRWFCTGNSWEIFGSYLTDPEKGRIEGLHLYPFHALRDYGLRTNDFSIGKTAEGIPLGGVRGSYSRIIAEGTWTPLVQVHRGAVSVPGGDGLRDHNLWATSYLGPVLSMNADWLQWLAEQLGQTVPDDPLFALLRDNQAWTHAKMEDPKVTRIIQD